MRLGLACSGGAAPPAVVALLRAAGVLGAELEGVQAPALVPASGSPASGHTWLVAAAADVLRACERGVLDAGFVGKPALLETGAQVYQLLDLGAPDDALVYAAAAHGGVARGARARIATRYPRVARRFFTATGRQAELVEAAAPVLAVGLGLAGAVVESRGALGAAGGPELRELETVAGGSYRLVCGRAARTLAAAPLEDLVVRLRDLEVTR